MASETSKDVGMRRIPRSALLGALAVGLLSGSHVVAYGLGSGAGDARATDGTALGADDTEGTDHVGSASWCVPAAVAFDALTGLDAGVGTLDEGVAVLEDLRAEAPPLAEDLQVLIAAYQSLAEGDLTPLGDVESAAAIDVAAADVTAQLAETCGLSAEPTVAD